MSSFKDAYLTNNGAELIAEAIAEGVKIEFIKMVVGDGEYEDEEKTKDALQQRTGLKSLRQECGFSSVEATDENAVKLKAIIGNKNVTEGYRIREIGIIAKRSGDTTTEGILYSIAVAEEADYLPSEDTPISYIQEYYTRVSNAENVMINVDMGAYAAAEDVEKLSKPTYEEPENLEELTSGEKLDTALGKIKKAVSELISHIKNKNNPHKVTKEQIGLGNAENTSDADKPVSNAVQEALDAYYAQLTAYADKAIADLINGAPTTLDTLKELADAINDNKSITDALNEAIGKKANTSELGAAAYRKVANNDTTTVDGYVADARIVKTHGNEIDELNTNLNNHKNSTSAHAWSAITGKPSTYTPSSHNHDNRYYTEAEINNLFASKIVAATNLSNDYGTWHLQDIPTGGKMITGETKTYTFYFGNAYGNLYYTEFDIVLPTFLVSIRNAFVQVNADSGLIGAVVTGKTTSHVKGFLYSSDNTAHQISLSIIVYGGF